MSRFASMVNAHLSAGQRKEASVAEAAERKKEYLDPSFKFNVNDARVIDADTVELPSGEQLRLGGEEGRAIDSYETNGSLYTKDERGKRKFDVHRRSYAEAFGLDPEDVTVDDLVIAGKSQKAKFQERLLGAAGEDGTISYRNRGLGKDNRTIAELDNDQLNLSAREDNAGYTSKFNFLQRLEDAAEGKTAEHFEGMGDRSLATVGKDQAVNLGVGAARMVNDLAQGVGTLAGINKIPGVDKAFHAAREGLDTVKEALNSPQQLRSERLDQERNVLQSELYNVQKEKYLKDGSNPINASIRAGIDEFTNSVGNLIDRPGAILDKTVESLPYMLGVASVGKAAVNTAVKGLQRQILKGTTKKMGGKAVGDDAIEALAQTRTANFLTTRKGKAFVNKIATKAGIGTVGLTEGLSTSAEVYDSIVNMTEEEALNSDKYVQLRQAGATHEGALRELAEDAHLQTLLSVTLAAGVAAAATGAGAFEGQLFSGLAGVRKGVAKVAADAAKAPTKKGAIRTVVGGVAKLASKPVKFAGPAATKEAVEELAQSGGGEFLSQLAKFDATGEEVGPGVGRAAGEGALVGFASGGGAQLTFGGLKALGTVDPRKIARAGQAFKEARTAKPINTTEAKDAPAPAVGAVSAEQEKVIDQPGLDSDAQVEKVTKDLFAGTFTDAEAVSAFTFAHELAKKASAAGKPISEANEERLSILRETAVDSLQETVDAYKDVDGKDLNATQIGVLALASELGIEVDTSKLTDEQKTIVESSAQLAVAFDELETNREEQVENTPDKAKTIRQVWNDKFGNQQKGSNGKPGLGWYSRKMREGMNALGFTTENEELNSVFSGLKNFVKSQSKYLQNARQAVAEKKNVGNFKYVAPNAEKGVAGSPAMLEILEREDAAMKTIVDQLGARYTAWKGAANPTIKSAVPGPAQTAPETSPDNSAEVAKVLQRLDGTSTKIIQKLAFERGIDIKGKRIGEIKQELAEFIARGAPEGTSAPNKVNTPDGQPKEATALRNELTALEADIGTDKLSNKKLIQLTKAAKRSGDPQVLKQAIALNKAHKDALKAQRIAKAAEKKVEEKVNKKVPTSDQIKAGTKFTTTKGRTFQIVEQNGRIETRSQKSFYARELFEGKEPGPIRAINKQHILNDSVQFEIEGLVGEENESAPATEPSAPAVAEGPTTLRQSIAEGGIVGSLDFIIANSRTKGAAVLAARIKQVIGDRKIPIVMMTQDEFVEKWGNPNAKAAYWQGKIYLNTTKLTTGALMQNSLLHEAIHAGFDGWLKTHQKSDEYKDLVRLNREVRLALIADGGKYAKWMAKTLAGKGGPEELLTHGMSNPWMQEFLQNMKVEDTTAWSKFVQMLASALGLTNDTALHKVISLTEQVFEKVNPTAEVQVVAEANAAAQPEQKAEGVDPLLLQEEADRLDRAIRTSELRRMATLLESGSITETDIYLANEEDLDFLNQLLEGGVPRNQAIAQLMAKIEPNPETAVQIASTVDQETIDKVANNAAILNDRENKEEIDARGIPARWRDFKNIVAGSVTKIAKVFDKFKLGTKLADMFAPQRSKVRDLLASDDFVMAVLTDPGAREQFFDKIGAKPAEQRALLAFSQFYQAFYDKLSENLRVIDPANMVNEASGGHGIGAIDVNLLPYFQDENGNLDPNVVGAMALEAMQWVTTRGAQTVSNSPDDIRAMFGLNDSDFITAEMWQAAGQGTVRTQVTAEIGYKALSHLNLKALPNSKPLIRETLAMALGAQAVTTLRDIHVVRGGVRVPLIYQHSVDRGHWVSMMGNKPTAEGSGGGPVQLIRNNSTQPELDLATLKWPRVDVNAGLRDALLEGREIFTKLFGSTSNVRTPVFEKPEQNSVPAKVARSLSKIPRKMRDRMLIDMQKHYELDTEVLDLIARFDPERFLAMAHDYTLPADLDNKHATERKGLEGKNAGLVRDLQEATNWAARYGAKAFYLPLKMIRSGRVYIDSNVINPQQSKLHRFMFIREGWKRDMTKAEPSALTGVARVQYEKFMVSIGLGIGIKAENFSRAEVVRQTEAYFQEGAEGKEALDVLAKNETFTEEDYSILERVLSKEGTHSLAALNAYGKWAAAANGEVVSIAIPMETDGITNGYTNGLMQTPPVLINAEYKALLNAGGVFFKGDPWQNWADYKAAGGLDNYQHIAKGTRAWLTHSMDLANKAEIKKGMDDQEVRSILLNRDADVVWSSGIVPDLDQLDKGNKEGRDWAKNPLMVRSYGSGNPSVVRAMIASAFEDFYKKLAESRNGTAKEVANALNRVYETANLVVDANKAAGIKKPVMINGQRVWVDHERVGTASADGRITAEEVQKVADDFYDGNLAALATELILSKEVKSLFSRGLAETYGDALSRSLDDRLAPVLEIRQVMNAGNKLSNILYTADFKRRVATLENDKGNRLTPEDRTSIREQMMREGLVPTIGTAASEGLEDSLETTNYEPKYYRTNREQIIQDESENSRTGRELQGGQALLQQPRQLTEIKYGADNTSTIPAPARSLSARITAQEPSSSVGVSAGVIGTHALDGVNNSAAWGQETYAVGNVHDAQLSPWWAADDVAGIANSDFGITNAGYAMPDQFLQTLLRMTASLLHPNDSRLSTAMKDRVASEMAGYQLEFTPLDIDWKAEGINPKEDPVRAGKFVSSMLIRELQNQTVLSLKGKEDLFGQIQTISQFAMEGAEAVFPDGIKLEGANDGWHLQGTQDTGTLISTMRDYLTQTAPIADQAVEWFKNILADPKADVATAFLSYLEHPATDAESALDMLSAAYGDRPLGAQLKVLNNILKPYISDVRTVKTAEEVPFAERTRTIHIAEGTENPVQEFMNQLLYAASLPRLREMQENNPTEYAELGTRAYKWAKGMRKSDKPGVARVANEILHYQQLDNTAMGIATFLGRTLSAPNSRDARNYELFFASVPKNFAAFTANLQQALRAGEKVSTVLFDEASNNEDIHSRYENLLESEKVAKIFEDLALLEQTAENPEHQARLRELIDTLVVPGLTSIAPILQQVAVDNSSTINTGETVQDVEIEGDIIRLQAAGNALTNNADSSLQEKAANEYVQNIVSHAVDTDHFIRKETRRLFELAKDQLDWTRMLPAEVTGDPQIAEERAKERYDWIFNNPDTAKGYKAFLSIGATNQAFGDALASIDNPDITFNAPVWSRGVLRGLMSVVRQAVQLLSGTTARSSGGTLKDATRALAQATIASNQRNQQRIAEAAEGPGGSKINRVNAKLVAAVNNRIVEPLGAGLASVQKKRLDPDNPTLPGFLKAATYVALKSRDSEVRSEYNKFYRSVAGPGVGKDNSFFEILSEITPWSDSKLGWIDLLRKSKYMVDMARQDATEHTRSFIMNSFDKNNHMTKAHKIAMTKTILKTDLSSLIDGEQSLDQGDLPALLNDPNAVDAEITRLEALLRSRLTNEGLDDRYQIFRNQYMALGTFMRTGKMPIGHGMLNAHNIVNQFQLPVVSRKAVTDTEVKGLIDRLASLNALKGQSSNDLRLTAQIVNHEMSRTDVPADNGFTRLIGMQINFKELAQEKLFKDNPVQMIKGYVYELFDGDVNIKYVQQGSPEEAQAEAEGMVLVGELPRDKLDQGPTRLLYKGLKGLATYNKAVVSLTDLQHRGANLFSTEGYRSQAALQKLAEMRGSAFSEALQQSKPDYTRAGTNVVPVLDDLGNIVDYRYMMSESNKQSVMKKEDPFDRVLPHMFGSLKDRPATVEVNRKVVDLLKEEHEGLQNNPEYRFVEISRTSEDEKSREMWRLLPEDMRRYAASKFGGDRILIRDDVVNLVLGFRKMSTLNIKDPTGMKPTIWGKATPIARIAEKVWLEIVSLMRIKIAVLTPAVVVGNIASNTAMLLGEGIPPNYIRKNAAEAISGMRQYQKDRKMATELQRRVGAAQALGQDTRQMELKLGRLEADIQANPVGKLVEEGLFTSITSDLGVDDDTIRGSMVQKIEDMASGKAPKGVVKLVKELYMLPGSKGYKAAVAATQYGDFVARYIKVKYDTQQKGVDPDTAIRDALASFIYYDIPQNKYLQAANDFGPLMFTKFFFRIQSVVAKMYSQNPASATAVLMLQRGLLPSPFNENIANYGLGSGLTQKPVAPWNLPGKAWSTLNPAEPAALDWLFNPLGL